MITLLQSDELRDVIAEELIKALGTIVQKPEQPQVPFNWVSGREAQKLLQVSPATLYRYRRSGQLRCSKIGNKVFFNIEDLDVMVKNSLEVLHYV